VTVLAARKGGISEPVSPWAGWVRKALALATVTRRSGAGPSPREYAARVRGLSDQAARGTSLGRRIWTLWRIESLTFACADRGGGRFRLADAALPLEAGPPAACGLAMAGVLETGFDGGEITRLLEARADPRFIDFAFESLGLMLAAYEPDLFGRSTAALGRLGVMRRYRLASPDPAPFLAALPATYRPYASHGFGRLLYFKRHGLRSVVAALAARPHVRFTPALKGALAAYVLVNGARLPRILALADAELPEELEEGVRGGLHNVVKLLAWSLPGSLDAVAAPGPRGAALLESAVAEARRRRDRGEGPDLRP
jgi:hypothetical protein